MLKIAMMGYEQNYGRTGMFKTATMGGITANHNTGLLEALQEYHWVENLNIWAISQITAILVYSKVQYWVIGKAVCSELRLCSIICGITAKLVYLKLLHWL